MRTPRLLFYALLGGVFALCLSCSGSPDNGNTPGTPAPTPGQQVTTLNIDYPAAATYSDGSAYPILGYTVYASPMPGYSLANLTTKDVGLNKAVPFSSFLPGDGVWYVSASEYDGGPGGTSGRTQNEVKIQAENGKFYSQ